MPIVPHNQKNRHIRSSRFNLSYELSAHLELRDNQGIEDNTRYIVQSYTAHSPPLTEFDPCHNQICGAWIRVLPLLSATGKRRPFLLSAVSTLATTLQQHSSGHDSYRSPLSRMHFDSLSYRGRALNEAQGTFHIEHCVAIVCLAVTGVSLNFENQPVVISID
jgi:hypothetical protein